MRTDIDKLEGRTRYLANRVDFATIQLSFVSPAQPSAKDAESVASKLRNAFGQAAASALRVVTGIIVIGGALSPILFSLLALALVIRVVYRRRRHIAARPLA